MKTITKEELAEKIKLHGEWLNDRTKGERLFLNEYDLSDSDLRGSDLSNSDLSYSDLRGSDLSDSDLRGSDLSNSDLSYSDLSYSDLRNSDLSYSDLRNSDLSYSDLRGSDLSGSDLDYSVWSLSCKTKTVKLCKKLQAQLLAHAFQVSPDVELPNDIHDFIKEHFHRYDEFFTRSKRND